MSIFFQTRDLPRPGRSVGPPADKGAIRQGCGVPGKDTPESRHAFVDDNEWVTQGRSSTWGLPDLDYSDDTMPASRTTLIDMGADTGTPSFDYIYDFGDPWCHKVRISAMPAG